MSTLTPNLALNDSPGSARGVVTIKEPFHAERRRWKRPSAQDEDEDVFMVHTVIRFSEAEFPQGFF